MPEQGMQELSVLMSWNSLKPKPSLLLELAPVLSEQMLSQAIDIAILIEDQPLRTEVVTALVDRIPLARREAVLGQAMAAARAVGQAEVQARALKSLLPFLPASLRKQALEAAWAIGDEERQIEVVSAILPSLSRPMKRKVLQRTLKVIRAIESGEQRARVLVILAPSLSSIDQISLLIEALGVVRTLRDNGRRASVLACFVQYLPMSLQTEVRQEWEELPGAGAVPPGFKGDDVIFGFPGIVGDRLRVLLFQIPEDERDALLKEVFQSIREEVLPTVPWHEATNALVLPAEVEEELEGGARASDIYRPVTSLPPASVELPAGAPPPRAEPPLPVPHPAQEQPQTPPPAVPAPREHKVSVGFSSEADPGTPLNEAIPLACKQAYYFWLEIGEPVQGAITESSAPPLPALPADAQLNVVLFPVKGVSMGSDAAIGELCLQADGSFRVVSQQPESLKLPPDAELRQQMLFFLIQTPENEGMLSFFCNIYYEQVLLQQRFIQARVALSPQPTDWGFTSNVDYVIDSKLSPDFLQRIATHRLSLMPIATDSTFNFCFFGAQDNEQFNHNVQVDAGKLTQLIQTARGALSKVAWGTTENWQPTDQYRYQDGARDLGRLEADLKELAWRGFQIYDAIGRSGALAGVVGDPNASDQPDPKVLSQALANLMREPGLVQIALTRSPNFVPPVALFYDYPLAIEAPNYTFCPAFEKAFNENTPLEELPCFQGNCPTKGNKTMICPSGFWGFRHCLGMPVSVGSNSYILPQIAYQDPLQWTTCFWTGNDFTMCAEHLQKLRALQPNMNISWHSAGTRADTIKFLQENTSPLIYFYCHGGADETGQPFLLVGTSSDYPIVVSDLNDVDWNQLPHPPNFQHPLIFINGCHTTALQPEQAVDFVSTLIDCGAVGVIGTDITIFEPLACAFAEECFRRFLGNEEIGEAVRGARLALLQNGNPLGLVYIPFVLPGLQLAKQ